jgi:hypothetical protein
MERRQLLAGCLLGPVRAFAGGQAMELRPHHLLDILTSCGNGEKFEPHPYGHALHIVGPKVLGDLALRLKLVVAADEICRPCVHLKAGKCDDVLGQLPEKPSKQEYNDNLDRRVLAYLKLRAGASMTVREYFLLVNERVPGIEKICTHPKEDERQRLAGLVNGLKKLGLRTA